MYSLYDMCKTDIESLDKMIFMLDHYCEASEVVDANQLKTDQAAKVNEGGEEDKEKSRIITKYVQIKRQMLVTDDQKMWVL